MSGIRPAAARDVPAFAGARPSAASHWAEPIGGPKDRDAARREGAVFNGDRHPGEHAPPVMPAPPLFADTQRVQEAGGQTGPVRQNSQHPDVVLCTPIRSSPTRI